MGRCEFIILGNSLEVSTQITTLLHGLLAGLNGTLVIALLELGGAKVVQVGDILVQLPSLLVMLHSLVELLLLVEVVTNFLLRITSLLGLLLGDSLLILRLRSRLLLGLRRRSRLGIRHGSVLGTGRTTLTTEVHINSKEHTHHLQETRVTDLFSDTVGVLLDLLQLGHEFSIGKQGGGLRVAGQLLEQSRVVEHASEAGTGVALNTVGGCLGIDGALDSAHS